VQFLRGQISLLTSQLTIAEDSLRRYREQERIVRLDEEANTEVSRFVSAQAERNALDAERSSLNSLIASADDNHAKHPDQSRYRQLVAFPSLLKNSAASELLQQLSTLEDQRSALLNRRTTQDPEVQGLTTRIDAIDTQIRTLAGTYLDGLDKQVAALDRTLGVYGGSLQHIPQKEVEYARLERGTKVLGDAYQLLQTRLKEAEIAQAVEDPSVRVIDPAVMPIRPLRPNKPVNALVGLLLGLLAGVGIAFARNGTDRTVRTRADVRLATGLPVLGLIPSNESVRRMTHPSRKKTLSALGGYRALPRPSGHNAQVAEIVAGGIVSDSYARLDANITQLAGAPSGKILMITSAMAGDGKTTSAMNLALTFAKRGQKVLLVDADLRNSKLNVMLGESASWGLSDLLSGHAELSMVLHQLEPKEEIVLDYIPAGKLRRDPAGLFASPRLRDFLTEMSVAYDVILVDTPPLIVPDAVVLSQRADGVLIIVRAGETKRNALEFAVQQLRVVDAPVLGAVINDIDFQRDESYDEAFGYYGSAYVYGYAGAQGSGPA
jgi:tyrosine-protein kinase Etk/Wzc